MTHTCKQLRHRMHRGGEGKVLPCGAAADAFRNPPPRRSDLHRMEMVNLSGVVDAEMMAAESETPRASNESGKKLARSLCRVSPTWNCHRLETPSMTIWEFEVFSWSAFKTNKGDLLIKLDFHFKKFGSLVPAPY